MTNARTLVEYYTQDLQPPWRALSPYGPRKDPFTGATVNHWGFDFGVPDRSQPYNNPVRTPWPGTVRATNNYATTRGLTASIAIEGNPELLLLQHLQSFSVKPGDVLPAGAIVGICGTTGRSTGIHLHGEIRKDDGSAIGNTVWGDPALYRPKSKSSEPAPGTEQIIMLSAGHGGTDSGAVANGVREKDVNLAVALRTRDALNQNYDRHRVIMARDRDIFVSLPDRREMARREQPAIFVSQHHDFYHDQSANGFGTHLSTGPLFAVTRQYREAIHNAIKPYMAGIGVRDRGMKYSSHWITANIPAPTVLIEYMFLSNPNEARLARDPGVQMALGIHTAEGIAKALGLPKKATAPGPQPPTPTPPTDETYRVIVLETKNKAMAEAIRDGLKTHGFQPWIEVKK